MKQGITTLSNLAHRLRDSTVHAVLTGGSAIPDPPAFARRGRCPLDDALRGRTVLLTGASSGIGLEIARKAASAGAVPLLVARSANKLDDLEQELRRAGGRAHAYPADLSSAESTESLLERLRRDAVTVDVLVNNAGRSIRRAVERSSDRIHDYERTMALNYFGSLRLILGLLPDMRARGRGHVINVSSAGVQMGTPLFSAYVASKAALDAFSRVAAAEVRDDGVRFSTVHMPLVRTPMIEPTPAYRGVPALDPVLAADLVLRPLVTREVELGTRLARLVSLARVLAPGAIEAAVSWGYARVQAA
jgi:short-subunit dehydrogenase